MLRQHPHLKRSKLRKRRAGNPKIPKFCMESTRCPVFHLTATFSFTVADIPEDVVVERTFRVAANTVEEA